MWGAIKSDLLSFVSTITDDTTRTLNRVLGEDEQEEEDVSIQEKKVADLRRSFETYDTPIRESDQRDYEKFKKKFNLSTAANDIAGVLDAEPEVSRYYAELVPIKITPEEFWSRLFFRVNQIYRTGGAMLDDEDDEEELVWEGEEDTGSADSTASVAPSGVAETSISSRSVASASVDSIGGPAVSAGVHGATGGVAMRSGSSQTVQQLFANSATNTVPSVTSNASAQTSTGNLNAATGGQVNVQELITVNEHMHSRVDSLERENQRLLQHEAELLRRVQELEALLAAQGNARQDLPEPPTPSSQLATGSPNSTPQSKRPHAQGVTAPTTTPPSHAYHNTATPPVGSSTPATTASAPTTAPSGKKKSAASTAKKLFDSPAPIRERTGEDAPTPNPTPTTTVEPATDPHVVAAAIAAAHVPVPEFASQSSEDSAVVINPSDLNSLAEDETPLASTSYTAKGPSGATRTASATGSTSGSASKSSLSQETAKYLAALDDQDDEEDGWS